MAQQDTITELLNICGDYLCNNSEWARKALTWHGWDLIETIKWVQKNPDTALSVLIDDLSTNEQHREINNVATAQNAISATTKSQIPVVLGTPINLLPTPTVPSEENKGFNEQKKHKRDEDIKHEELHERYLKPQKQHKYIILDHHRQAMGIEVIDNKVMEFSENINECTKIVKTLIAEISKNKNIKDMKKKEKEKEQGEEGKDKKEEKMLEEKMKENMEEEMENQMFQKTSSYCQLIIDKLEKMHNNNFDLIKQCHVLVEKMEKEKNEALSHLAASFIEKSEQNFEEQKKMDNIRSEELSKILVSVDAKIVEERRQKKEVEDKLQLELKEATTNQLFEEIVAMKTGKSTTIHILPNNDSTAYGPKDMHFRLAESQFFRMCGTNRGRYVVSEVLYHINPALIKRYDSFKAKAKEKNQFVEERLMFHGTASENIPKIMNEGFRIGGVDVTQRYGAVHGTGVYTSEDPSFAMGYITNGHNSLLFSKVTITKDSFLHHNSARVLEQLVSKSTEQLLPCYVVKFKTI